MSNIYQIGQEYLELSEILQDNGGELTEELELRLAINESNLVEKSTGYIQVIKSLDSENDIIDSEIKRLQGLKSNRTKTINRLKETVKDAMLIFGKDKIETPLYKITFRSSKSVEIYDADLLPPECLKVEVVTKPISKTDIKKLIDSGKEIPGAKVVENRNLQIK